MKSNKIGIVKSKLFYLMVKYGAVCKVVSVVTILAFSQDVAFGEGVEKVKEVKENAAELDKNLIGAIKSIWLILRDISPYSTGIGVACGAYLKKFSMGKQDKIDAGSNLIKQSILGFVLINGLGIILDYINSEIIGNKESISQYFQ